jgi:hypothetical protein
MIKYLGADSSYFCLLNRQVIATLLIIYRVASGKACSDSAQEIISVLPAASSTAASVGSRMRFAQTESMSEVNRSFQAVDMDKGGNEASNSWPLQNIKVRIDRENNQFRGHQSC